MKTTIKFLVCCMAAVLASCSGSVKPESTNVKGDDSSDARVVTLNDGGVSVEVSADKGGKSVVIVPVEFVLEKTISEVEMAEATLKLTTADGVKKLSLSKEESESLGFFISANARGEKKVVNFTAEMKTAVAHQVAESAKSYRIEDFKLMRKGDKDKQDEASAKEAEKTEESTEKAAPAQPQRNELKEAANQSAQAPRGQTLTGTIKGAGGITMYINNATGKFWYYYNKYGPSHKLYLTVASSGGNYLELNEYNDEGLCTGAFSGTLKGNSYSGTFIAYISGKQYPFSLH